MAMKKTTLIDRKFSSAGQKELTKVRDLCLSISGTLEKLSHGSPTWFTKPKGKVFAIFDNHHHGSAHISLWLPAPPDVARGLVDSDGERYWIPPYLGYKGWFAVILDSRPSWKTVEALISQAYAFISAKK
jgi:predicted DNA-binding protein (MmcQ/YjbR family)